MALLAGQDEACGDPFTRDEGSAFVSLTYSRIAASGFYAADFEEVALRPGYVQQALTFRGEIGIIGRWLTASVEAQLYRDNELVGLVRTSGVGDVRLGVWTGLVERPLRVTLGFLAGLPVGDAHPTASGASPDHDAQLLAAMLPTGNGDFNYEPRLALGYRFGGHGWPLQHAAVVELGYWLRTENIANGFTYLLELRTQAKVRFAERFVLAVRLFGVESFAASKDAAQTPSGLGNGVTYTALGGELEGRIFRGFAAALGVFGPLRGRAVADGADLHLSLRYDY